MKQNSYEDEWTKDYAIFKNFIDKTIRENESVKEYYDFLNIKLSDLSNKYFKKDFETLMKGFRKTANQNDYLKFHFKRTYINPELLTEEKRKKGNGRIKLGYVFGLTQIDFIIWDFIDPEIERNPYKFLGIYPGELKTIYDSMYGDSLPLTVDNLFEKFNNYISKFKKVAEGYAQFLMQNEIKKMLIDLENNKTIDLDKRGNMIKHEIGDNIIIPKKLKWNASNIQLYDVIRQLKKKELISNSYVEIAGFICQNFEGFESNYSTVLKEIQREQRPPKNKRIDLNLSVLPEIEENLPK